MVEIGEKSARGSEPVSEYLLRPDGSRFSADELKALATRLNGLSVQEREQFRNENAAYLATSSEGRLLIVSGPGTGKSHLFKQRIAHWLSQAPSAEVLAVSFVRKLVADLDSEIQLDTALTVEQKQQVAVHTLHRMARATLEKAHGTDALPMRPHIRVIAGSEWEEEFWADTLLLAGSLDPKGFPIGQFHEQLNAAMVLTAPGWQEAMASAERLAQYYNAVTFGQMIKLAEEAIATGRAKVGCDFAIVDEYQDFNTAEEVLIKQLVAGAEGVLFVGDDDQVLYEFKGGDPTLIRNLYHSADWANGALPLCGRCDHHIALAASGFLAVSAESKRIDKLLEPISDPSTSAPVDVVLCPTPASAVDLIAKFLEENKAELAQRAQELADGRKKDPFLLILTPSRRGILGKSRETLDALLQPYVVASGAWSQDYRRLRTYYLCSLRVQDNWLFRQVLRYEGREAKDLVEMIALGVTTGTPLAEFSDPRVDDVKRRLDAVRQLVESQSGEALVREIGQQFPVKDPDALVEMLAAHPLTEARDADAESADAVGEAAQTAAVEMMTVVGSKGLSAEHVIILGCDATNGSRLTRNAFYVGMTRARRSLSLVVALRAGGAKAAHPHLNDVPEEHCRFVKYKKQTRAREVLRGRKDFEEWTRRLGAFRSKGKSSRNS